MKLFSALYHSHDPFFMFDSVIPVTEPDDLDKEGALLLHGGADISPSIYGQRASKVTYAADRPSKRDREELALVERAVKLGIPIIGICRGAQLMCAFSGGKLVQDVSNHSGPPHRMMTKEGVGIFTNSLHHQMMIPDGTNHELLAWCDPKLSPEYIGEKDMLIEVEVEPEMVYFKDTKALAIQGHPEFLTQEDSLVRYCQAKIKEFYNVV